MTHITNVMNGMSLYVDNELLPKINGYQKWLLGTYAGVLLSKGNELIHIATGNDFVKTLGLVDNEGNVDLDTLYAELKKQAEKSSVVLQIPLVGNITLNSSDVDKVYSYIQK